MKNTSNNAYIILFFENCGVAALKSHFGWLSSISGSGGGLLAWILRPHPQPLAFFSNNIIYSAHLPITRC
jgi:hypothetical protein